MIEHGCERSERRRCLSGSGASDSWSSGSGSARALFSLLAIATALVAIVAEPYIPRDVPTKIGADAVDNILGIIASSMLAVTTFSLSTMVSAYSAATSNVTPRATRLVMEDSTTQNVLATFVGSFLYSLVAIIALSTGAYGETGRVVLFIVTIVVIALIVVTLLRWTRSPVPSRARDRDDRQG